MNNREIRQEAYKQLLINELSSKKDNPNLQKHLDGQFNQKEIQLISAIHKVETMVRPFFFRMLELVYSYLRITMYLFNITKSFNTTVGPLQIGVLTSFKWRRIEPSLIQLFKEPALLMTLQGSCTRMRSGLDFYYSQTKDFNLLRIKSFASFFNGPNAKMANKIPYYQVLQIAGFETLTSIENEEIADFYIDCVPQVENAINCRMEKLKSLVENPEKLSCSVILVNQNNRRVFFKKYFGNQVQMQPCLSQPRLVASIAKFPLYLQVYEKLQLQNDSILDDCNVQAFTNKHSFSIRNADNSFRGPVTLRYAFGNSINSIAIQLIQQLGIESYVSYIRLSKIHRPLPNSDLLALGAYKLTGLELLTLFSPIMHEGHIVYHHRNNLSRFSGQKIFSDSTINEIRESLRETVANGTAKYLDKIKNNSLIGKTGTSEKNRDFWYVGTAGSNIYGLVWIGNYDESEVLGKNGYQPSATRFAVPMWSDIAYSLNNFK